MKLTRNTRIWKRIGASLGLAGAILIFSLAGCGIGLDESSELETQSRLLAGYTNNIGDIISGNGYDVKIEEFKELDKLDETEANEEEAFLKLTITIKNTLENEKSIELSNSYKLNSFIDNNAKEPVRVDSSLMEGIKAGSSVTGSIYYNVKDTWKLFDTNLVFENVSGLNNARIVLDRGKLG